MSLDYFKMHGTAESVKYLVEHPIPLHDLVYPHNRYVLIITDRIIRPMLTLMQNSSKLLS